VIVAEQDALAPIEDEAVCVPVAQATLERQRVGRYVRKALSQFAGSVDDHGGGYGTREPRHYERSAVVTRRPGPAMARCLGDFGRFPVRDAPTPQGQAPFERRVNGKGSQRLVPFPVDRGASSDYLSQHYPPPLRKSGTPAGNPACKMTA
jgi:hypothetical protein